MKSLEAGVSFVNDVFSILHYADDIILIAENEEDLQKMLTTCANLV